MPRERIFLEHVLEGGVEPIGWDLPRDQRTARKVRRHQGLTHAADRSGAQHRDDALE